MPPTLYVHRGFPIRAALLMFQDTAATVPADLTGCTFEAVIGRPDGPALVELTVTATDAANGELLIEAADASTLPLTGTLYGWTLTVTDSEGHPEVITMGPVHVSTAPGTQSPP
jgi:hypothetical protein